MSVRLRVGRSGARRPDPVSKWGLPNACSRTIVLPGYQTSNIAKLVNGMRRTVSALLLGTLVAVSTAACSAQQYADGSGSITMSITTSTTSANTPTASTPSTLSGHPVCATDGLAISFGPASTAMNYVYQ